MSEIGEMYGMHADLRKARRKLFGVDCPECVRMLPKACPTILLPQQRCRIHKYRDPRPQLTESQEEQVAESLGWTMKVATPQAAEGEGNG